MSFRTYLLPLTGLLLLTAHCGDDSGDDDDDDGSGGSTSTSSSTSSGTGGSTSSSTSSGGGSGGSTSSTSSSGSGSVETCQDLCDLAPVDPTTGACVSAFVTGLGYDTSAPVCQSTAVNTSVGCMACYDAIEITDGDCIATHSACF